MDPAGHVTEYTYDSLGHLLRVDSPDTGLTLLEYDEAGNRVARTDARGVRTEFAYDALNRMVSISYPDSTLDIRYSYDQGEFGKSRLTRMTDSAGVTDYTYDPWGNLVRETQTMGGTTFVTSYGYDASGRLTQIVYPSGMSIDYGLNTNGRVMSIDKGGALESETLVFDVAYAPFGPATSFFYGNGSRYGADLDLDYRIDRLQSGNALEWTLQYDPAGQVLLIDDLADSRLSQQFQLDPLSRLESAQGPYGSELFAYDANGNRTRFVSGTAEEVYGYLQQSNQLVSQGGWSFSRDPAGNRIEKIDDAADGYRNDYGDHNRLSRVSTLVNGVESTAGTYRYNGKGQRVHKSVDGKETWFVFGGAGKLLGEYSTEQSGSFSEYVYLGDLPVAVVRRFSESVTPPGKEWILDGGDPGTAGSGDWQARTEANAYGGDYLFARKAAGHTYRWTTTLPDGRYEVFAWWVDRKNQSADVHYTIQYGPDESESITANHKTGGGQWQSLFQYRTRGGENFVEVRSDSNKFVADAVRWLEIPSPVQTWTESTHYIHFDHLGTPRRITDRDGVVVWRWDSSPFGNTPPDQDPDGNTESLTFNLRFRGQYFDAESGLHYNYFRTYDPGMGRYIESDPIGLSGSLDTFSYVGSDPLNGVDPFGLIKIYGSWCGPDWTGGFRKSYEELGAAEKSVALPPVDALDQCCKTHDITYANCRAKLPCDRQSRQQCFQRADLALSACAANAGKGQPRTLFLGKDPGKVIEDFFRDRTPAAEDNAEGCACEK
jgi:RHS repeat-associated protein